MKQLYYFLTIGFLTIYCATAGVTLAQENFILKNPGKIFKTKERKPCPGIKTRYLFETGIVSGREFLKQQDLLDNKGKMKSSGTFSEEGNKESDIRYFYDASGILTRKEQQFIGTDRLEITWLTKSGSPEKIQLKNKSDSLLTSTEYIYDEKGHCLETKIFQGNKLMKRQVMEDVFNEQGNPLQTHHYELDSNGMKTSNRNPFVVYEYDNQGMILQQTEYSNKEKRKMLKWIYYKYQLDNDYRIVRRSGFNEEQTEISRTELIYTDSSITATEFQLCDCPSKSLDKQGGKTLIFNSYGEMIKEQMVDKDGITVQSIFYSYDEYGNCVDKIVQQKSEPEKIKRSKTVLEFYTEQAKASK